MRDAGVASATVYAWQQVGGVIGAALLDAVMAPATTSHLPAHAAGATGADALRIHPAGRRDPRLLRERRLVGGRHPDGIGGHPALIDPGRPPRGHDRGVVRFCRAEEAAARIPVVAH
ncbi:hypothetical protein [Streptomyces pacificus]|uniref:Uncharacterized protein n=1 Tax=Streptomyces pacificus TaxID=2705029 RepID=A0A6A0B421_9ACTN|nr:hypothetical protein [Streptomyces pacificus]GFH39453.1 hypothetical protein SCWH03_57200 [Streptomyces pacificus]